MPSCRLSIRIVLIGWTLSIAVITLVASVFLRPHTANSAPSQLDYGDVQVAFVDPSNDLKTPASRVPASGILNAGLRGEYFANPNLAGTPAFNRRDVRIRFNFGAAGPAGSISNGFRNFPHSGFSVRWSGELMVRQSQRYRFKAVYHDGLRLALKSSHSRRWQTLINDWPERPQPLQTQIAGVSLQAGKRYDIRIEYRDLGERGSVTLDWSSLATPETPLEAASGAAINVVNDGFTDAMKMARDEWKAVSNGQLTGRDAKRDVLGWPLEDASVMVWEGDAGHQGSYRLIFNGMAQVRSLGAGRIARLRYHPDTNTTTATLVITDKGRQNFRLVFSHTRRSPASPINSGITNVRLYRPTAPGSARPFAPGSLFLPVYKQALARFVALRFMFGTNWNDSVAWADRTLPAYSTQRYTRPGESGWETNGMAWEYRVMLCNETGKDLYINVPALANDDYVTKLAQLIRYGSDGRDPYSSPQAHPRYPPLDSNLNVYIEYANEVWNYGFAAWKQNFDAAQKAVKNHTADGEIVTYDGATDPNVLWNRRFALRSLQISNLFRRVFGDRAMGPRVRMLLEWQYANYGWPPTAETQLTFLDDYFNNADGESHVANPHPISHFFWGGGGAAYYGAGNEQGSTTILQRGRFEAPAVSGFLRAPPASRWQFTGSAGVTRGGTVNGNPPAAAAPSDPLPHHPIAYLQGRGAMSIKVTFPKHQSSKVYGATFLAAGRKGAKTQSFDIYLDGKNINRSDRWPGFYQPGERWQRMDSATFAVAPGSTHTLTFASRGGQSNAVTFIDAVAITSVDAIFAADIPAQSEGSLAQYQRRLAITGAWANLYGLRFVAYEGGWALGGDGGGSPVQNYAKYRDPRAAEANLRSLDAFYRAGGTLYTFGTYSQWSGWEAAAGEPLPRSIDQSNATLPPSPEAIVLPGVLRFPQRIRDLGDKNLNLGSRSRMAPNSLVAWNILAPQNGRYRFSANLRANRPILFVVDGTPLHASGDSATARLGAGLHSVRVKLGAVGQTTAAGSVTARINPGS